MKCKFRSGALVLAFVWAASGMTQRLPSSAPPAPDVPKDMLNGPDFDLAIMLQGDLRGQYGLSGPPSNPLGGFARRTSYWNAFARKYPASPFLRLDAGSIFSVGAAESGVVNRWMLEGTCRSRLDALNLSRSDLPGWQEIIGLAAAGSLPREFLDLPLVSANVKPKLPGFPAVQRYVVKNMVCPNVRKTFRVGITGLLYDPQETVASADFEIQDPQTAAREVVRELQSRSNYIVLLVDCDAGRAISLAALLPSIDLVAVAHDYVELAEPHQVGNTLIVMPANGGRLLNEIRIAAGSAPETVTVTSRFVPLDRNVPDDPSMSELIRNAQAAVQQVLRAR